MNVCLKALPYVKGYPGVSFKWSRDGASCNELRLEKVMTEHCTGYYSCEIIKNGEHLFSVHHCLKARSKLPRTQYNESTKVQFLGAIGEHTNHSSLYLIMCKLE